MRYFVIKINRFNYHFKIFASNSQGQLDNIETLIYTIVTNFIRSPKDITAATDILLTNLRCSTLEDYNWYKGTLLTYLLKREGFRQAYWKKKFKLRNNMP